MKKYIVIILVFTLMLTMASCSEKSGVLDEAKTYEVTSTIRSVKIEINAADFTIVYGDDFWIESNLKGLSVSESGGVLTLVDKIRNGINYTDAMLTLHLPHGIVFEDVDIATGAANLTADSLSADSLSLKLGAGNVEFGCLNAYENAEIKGGAGEITVNNGTLKDLSLSLGVGRLDLTAALPGESELKLGVGESKLTLIGSPDDYKLDVEEGIGSITIDRNFGSGSSTGQHRVEIEGGVGSADVSFRSE